MSQPIPKANLDKNPVFRTGIYITDSGNDKYIKRGVVFPGKNVLITQVPRYNLSTLGDTVLSFYEYLLNGEPTNFLKFSDKRVKLDYERFRKEIENTTENYNNLTDQQMQQFVETKLYENVIYSKENLAAFDPTITPEDFKNNDDYSNLKKETNILNVKQQFLSNYGIERQNEFRKAIDSGETKEFYENKDILKNTIYSISPNDFISPTAFRENYQITGTGAKAYADFWANIDKKFLNKSGKSKKFSAKKLIKKAKNELSKYDEDLYEKQTKKINYAGIKGGLPLANLPEPVELNNDILLKDLFLYKTMYACDIIVYRNSSLGETEYKITDGSSLKRNPNFLNLLGSTVNATPSTNDITYGQNFYFEFLNVPIPFPEYLPSMILNKGLYNFQHNFYSPRITGPHSNNSDFQKYLATSQHINKKIYEYMENNLEPETYPIVGYDSATFKFTRIRLIEETEYYEDYEDGKDEEPEFYNNKAMTFTSVFINNSKSDFDELKYKYIRNVDNNCLISTFINQCLYVLYQDKEDILENLQQLCTEIQQGKIAESTFKYYYDHKNSKWYKKDEKVLAKRLTFTDEQLLYFNEGCEKKGDMLEYIINKSKGKIYRIYPVRTFEGLKNLLCYYGIDGTLMSYQREILFEFNASEYVSSRFIRNVKYRGFVVGSHIYDIDNKTKMSNVLNYKNFEKDKEQIVKKKMFISSQIESFNIMESDKIANFIRRYRTRESLNLQIDTYEYKQTEYDNLINDLKLYESLESDNIRFSDSSKENVIYDLKYHIANFNLKPLEQLKEELEQIRSEIKETIEEFKEINSAFINIGRIYIPIGDDMGLMNIKNELLINGILPIIRTDNKGRITTLTFPYESKVVNIMRTNADSSINYTFGLTKELSYKVLENKSRFIKSFLNKETMSTYNDKSYEFLKFGTKPLKYGTSNAYKFGVDFYHDINKKCYELDISLCHTTSLYDLEYLAVFCIFDFPQYINKFSNEYEIDKYSEYIVEHDYENELITFVCPNNVDKITGELLIYMKSIGLNIRIIYELKPHKIEYNKSKVAIKEIIENFKKDNEIQDRGVLKSLFNETIGQSGKHRSRNTQIMYFEDESALANMNSEFSEGHDVDSNGGFYYCSYTKSQVLYTTGFLPIYNQIINKAKMSLLKLYIEYKDKITILGTNTDSLIFQCDELPILNNEPSPILGDKFKIKEYDRNPNFGDKNRDVKLPSLYCGKEERKELKIKNEYNINEYLGSRFAVIGKYPGVGKSTFAVGKKEDNIKSYCNKDTTIIVCPQRNGIANFELEGFKSYTAHGFFKMVVGVEQTSDQNIDLKGIDTIVFDEAYLMNIEVLTRIYTFMQNEGKNLNYIFNGDKTQLKPVKQDLYKDYKEFYDFIIIDVFCRGSYIMLNEVKRGNDGTIRSACDWININQNLPTSELIRQFKDIFNIKIIDTITNDTNYSHITYYKITRDNINKIYANEDISKNDKLISKFNNKKFGFVNNREYYVLSVDIKIKLIDSFDEIIEIDPKILKEFMEKSKIIHGYAYTCHSVQGKTIKNKLVIHDTNSARITYDWLYVAVSRCTTLDNVYFMKTYKDITEEFDEPSIPDFTEYSDECF